LIFNSYFSKDIRFDPNSARSVKMRTIAKW